jgi:membrane protein required for colicin V production
MAFLLTFALIIVAVALIGRALTTVVDIAQLSLPNKVAGTLFGVMRKTFVLSVVLNILFAAHQRAWAPSLDMQQDSVMFGPIRAIAPTIVPALGETKWVKRALEDLEREVGNTGME